MTGIIFLSVLRCFQRHLFNINYSKVFAKSLYTTLHPDKRLFITWVTMRYQIGDQHLESVHPWDSDPWNSNIPQLLVFCCCYCFCSCYCSYCWFYFCCCCSKRFHVPEQQFEHQEAILASIFLNLSIDIATINHRYQITILLHYVILYYYIILYQIRLDRLFYYCCMFNIATIILILFLLYDYFHFIF